MKSVRGQKLVEEYIAFCEKITDIELDDMKSTIKKDAGQLYQSFKTLILTLKKDRKNFLVKVLGTNHDNSKNFIDMKQLGSLYETMSYSDALAESVGTFFHNEVEEMNLIGSPDTPVLRKDFIKFQKELRKKKNEYDDILDSNENYALDYFFGNIESLDQMNEIQQINRENMMKLQSSDVEAFNLLWVRGAFHLATIISRLENTNYPETKLMREEILKRNQVTLEVKDYGLTVSEILSGLQVAKKVNERYLYKAFSEGNLNLKAMTLILRSGDLIEENDRFAALKTMQALCNDPGMRKLNQDPDKYVSVRKFIKKYNLPTHQNWRKED